MKERKVLMETMEESGLTLPELQEKDVVRFLSGSQNPPTGWVRLYTTHRGRIRVGITYSIVRIADTNFSEDAWEQAELWIAEGEASPNL